MILLHFHAALPPRWVSQCSTSFYRTGCCWWLVLMKKHITRKERGGGTLTLLVTRKKGKYA